MSTRDNGMAEYALVIDEDTIYGCDYIYYLPLKFPTLFTPAYESMQDLINECKSSKLAKYLPKDFDYRSNVRYVVGTYYG